MVFNTECSGYAIKGEPGPPGPAGPTAVSTDEGNIARLGSDDLIYVPPTVTNLHWIGFDNAIEGVASNDTTLVELGVPVAGSDVSGWYSLDDTTVTFNQPGVYLVSGSVLITAPGVTEQTERRFQISLNPVPLAGAVETGGSNWAQSVSIPAWRIGEGENVRFSLFQASGVTASVHLFASVVYLGP